VGVPGLRDRIRRPAHSSAADRAWWTRAIAVRVARTLFALAILGGLATGCAEYRPEPLSAAASARDLENRTLDDPRLHRFVLASLTGENEPHARPFWDLTTLTLAAIYYHPDLDIARAKLAVSRAGMITAGQRPNPILNFSAVLNTAAVPGAIAPAAIPLTIGPVIDLLVETFGKREYRLAQASHLAEAARGDLATAGWQVRAGVRTALLNLWAARQRMALIRQRLLLQATLVRLIERRLAVGEANALDVSRERINHDRTLLGLRELERAADQAKAQLATAIGVPARALASATLSFDAFARAPPNIDLASGDLRRRALTGRTDVQAALAEYEAAQSALQLAVANQFPNVTLGPGYTYDVGVNKFSIGPSVELPVFNQNQGQIAEAAAKREQAAAMFTALQARIIGAIETSLAAYQAATRELTTADALLAAARRREDTLAASFRAGRVDRPTMIAGELETATVRLARFDALVQQRQALGAFEDALQHPLYEPALVFSVPQASPRPGSESVS
jgi:cobalt-zinc-cadmium efflux system outer membrane protein